jgi:asparagine synthase (glutamine-hydrolysing)
MCGITFCLTKNVESLMDPENALRHRGPEQIGAYRNDMICMFFNRLAINDIENGSQPMKMNSSVLICNGEIFNYKELITEYDFEMKTKSDCEVILHLYEHLKKDNDNEYNVISNLCNLLDGEFSFCLYDKSRRLVYFARDPYGVRPLFYDTMNYSFASEAKAFFKTKNVKQFPPGHFAILSEYSKISSILPYNSDLDLKQITFDHESVILKNIHTIFTKAVKKRVMSDRNICALLSGGLDSSLVCAILSKFVPKLKTFSIGMKGSPDLENAKKVAEHIRSDHITIELTKKDFIDAIATVIRTIESYDTTTVRASVGNYLVAKYISEHTDCKVVFNGDYADEVCGGYKYFKKCTDPLDFHEECVRLVKDIHYFDSLRSDRTISNFGLEARVPFADKDFVTYYLSINPLLRMSNTRTEKYLLRKAFEVYEPNILPYDVLWRPKEAFSDGVSPENNSWADILQKHINLLVDDDKFKNSTFKLKETYYYYSIYINYYDGELVPYLWMPRFCDTSANNDPSARKLS